MFRNELDSFVQKFKNLCQAGANPNLSMKSKAGKVLVSLQAEFDLPLSPCHVPSRSRRIGPSQQRRRERRLAERKAASEEAAADIPPEEAVLILLAEVAAKANAESSKGTSMSEKNIVEPSESSNTEYVSVFANATEEASVAVEALTTSDEIKCEECDSTFENSEALRKHEQRNHNITSSPIPQIVGANYESKSFAQANSKADLESQSLKNYYPRNCQHCSEFLRNNSDFRKHIVGCMMAR